MRLGMVTFILLTGALGGPAIGAADSDRDWCDTQGDGWSGQGRHCEVREVPVSAEHLFQIDARPNGGVQVQGSERGEPRLLARVEATADTDAEARALADAVRIETAGTIHAEGPERSGRDRRWSVSYRLMVPRRSDLRLEADNGGLSVEGVVGNVELKTLNGGLHLEAVGGRVRGETVNGGIHVDLTGAEWEGEGLDLRTTNGGVHLNIPSGYNARLEARTVNGGVHTDLPVAGTGRNGRARSIETDLGRGGRLLRVETTNGGLHVGRD